MSVISCVIVFSRHVHRNTLVCGLLRTWGWVIRRSSTLGINNGLFFSHV